MTEAEWLAGSEPWSMLPFVKSKGAATNRKLRLFAIACCRVPSERISDDHRRALEVSERYADGLATIRELRKAHNELHSSVYWVAKTKSWWAQALVGFLADLSPTHDMADEWTPSDEAMVAAVHRNARRAAQLAMHAHATDYCRLSELLKDLFGNPFRPSKLASSSLTWNDGAVVKLAREMYEANAFERMPALGKLLEQAGCRDEEVLSHCRGPGPHVKGCYVVDLLLNKA